MPATEKITLAANGTLVRSKTRIGFPSGPCIRINISNFSIWTKSIWSSRKRTWISIKFLSGSWKSKTKFLFRRKLQHFRLISWQYRFQSDKKNHPCTHVRQFFQLFRVPWKEISSNFVTDKSSTGWTVAREIKWRQNWRQRIRFHTASIWFHSAKCHIEPTIGIDQKLVLSDVESNPRFSDRCPLHNLFLTKSESRIESDVSNWSLEFMV